MPFESLSERFQAAFKKLRGKGKLSEEDVSEALKEMRRALLEADVNFKVVKSFVAPHEGALPRRRGARFADAGGRTSSRSCSTS